MPDLSRSQATRQQGPRRWRRGGLLVKFLLILMPLFLMLAGPGIGFLVHYALDEDKEALAVRFGNHAGRVASAIARHDPIADPEIAQDLIATLGADLALICAELRNDPDGRVLASQPPRIGCRRREEGLLLAIPVGDAGAYTLAIRFSDAEMREEQRLTIAVSLSVIALAFLLAVVASTIGFRIIVGQPLKLLLRAIELSAATGERRAVGGTTSSDR